MDWADVNRGVAYLRDAEGIDRCREYLRGRSLGDAPILVTWGEVCRPELLFEIEVDAIASR
jgi:hypothetical protein